MGTKEGHCNKLIIINNSMRQRAAAAATPPRSAESESSWQAAARHRGSYQGEPQGSLGGDSPPADNHARRRRGAHPLNNTTNTVQQPKSLMHSPQHYLSEYNKNYHGIDGSNSMNTSTSGTHLGGTHESAPHSAGALPSRHGITRIGSGREREGVHNPNATASDVYYAQYGNHYAHHQHSSSNLSSLQATTNNNPNLLPNQLRRNHSTGSSRNAHRASFQHFEATFHLDPNPIAALHFRKALHVPDNKYRELIHGHGRDQTPTLNPICCANCCAGFSMVGFAFLFFIGILLDTQPLFISGALPSATRENDAGKTSTIYLMTNERLDMASNAYQTSYVYLATAIVCLIYVYYERLDQMAKRRSYQELPDHMEAGSTVGVIDGESSIYDPPLSEGGGSDAAAYQLSHWNRLASVASGGAIKMKQWAGTAAGRVWNGRNAGSSTSRSRQAKLRSKNFAKTV